MSQPAAQLQLPAHPQFVMVPVREGNGLGVAGFFIALVGLFVPTGLVALLGLLISLVALGRGPRGFAAMGVLIGLLGTAFWGAVMVAVVLGAIGVGFAVLVAVALVFAVTNPELIEFTRDMSDVGLAVIEYQDREGAVPEELAMLGLSVPSLTDPWGNPYRYRISGDSDLGFDVASSGSDGTFDTADDLVLSRLDRVWEDAFENFGQKMEELGDRIERVNRQHRFQDHHRASIRIPYRCTAPETLTRQEVYEQVAKSDVMDP